ncbi:MAG: hypothetical protein H0T62_10200 [Parachlamydiaceae bacterium]|nr:hypothetical protein [Parachlamydiaceae bacterium]
MRTYYAHLETLVPEVDKTLSAHPNFRSSAIFPIIKEPGLSVRLLFLGYWLLKRKIDHLTSVITLRSREGTPIARKILTIAEAKAYRIELSDLLQATNIPENASFEGSLEIEFFSAENLVFPFPAVVINYYGDSFSSVVHTAQRVYNDYEDMQKNSQTLVPESGFNIYVNEVCEPFLGLINGAFLKENAHIDLEFFNHKGQTLTLKKELGTLKPYETIIIHPSDELDLRSFLDGQVGSCKAQFDVNWIFPRLLVGNKTTTPTALSITHTYYDCSNAASKGDYWNSPELDWHPATLMFPLFLAEDRFTNLYFYPIYSPSLLAIDVEFYTETGTLLATKKQELVLKSPMQEYAVIHLTQLAKELGCIASKGTLAVKVIARPLEDSLLPTRIKVGFDVGHENQGLPCNICMNLQLFNPSLAAKPSSFKWLPILADQPAPLLWLMNSSPHMNFNLTATVALTIFREKDESILKRNLKILPNGFITLSSSDDKEVAEFLKGTIGWATAITNNGYLTTYYFADNPSGTIGGDHGF